jgi:hypothetical protein
MVANVRPAVQRLENPMMRPLAVTLPEAARKKLAELQLQRGAAEDVLEVLFWKGAA